MTQADKSKSQTAIKRRIPRRLGLIIFLFDVAMLMCGFLIAKFTAPVLSAVVELIGFDGDVMKFETHKFYYLFLCACILGWFVMKGHYSRRLPWLAQVESIFKAIFLAASIDIVNHFFFYGAAFPFMTIINWMMCVIFILAGRYISFYLITHSKRWYLPTVLVGGDRMVMDSMYAFAADGLTGYDIRVVLLTAKKDPDFSMDFLPRSGRKPEIIEGHEKFAAFIESNPQYYYLFDLDELRGANKEGLIAALEKSGVEYGVIPHTRDLDIYGMEPHYFFGNDVMILHRRDKIKSPSGRAIKRTIDVFASFFAVLVIGIMAVIIFAQRKISKSDTPIFYGGHRVGMNGKLFKCWKFCTMRKNADKVLAEMLDKDPVMKAEWDKFQKLKNDPRVDSTISRILRKTSLDELPQLWNVFVGDMSLVGPRPILPDQKKDYGDLIEQYQAVRPGLTGLWQVSGRNETSFAQRVYWDGWYIKNWSLWYDIVILFKTVRVFLTGSGAY